MTQENIKIKKAAMQPDGGSGMDLIFENPIDTLYRWLMEMTEMENTSILCLPETSECTSRGNAIQGFFD